ncbi:3286_t:CDS:2, partial [Funneliformis mosseae]
CKPPQGVNPKAETTVPNNRDKKHKITTYTTITITNTLYYDGYATTITTINSLGNITTFATYISPSTVITVKTMVSPVTLADDEDKSSTTIRLHELNNHSLWVISLIVVVASLVISVFV